MDVVLSDMAHSFTGNATTDHLIQLELCEAAFDFAESNLNKGGSFVCKVRIYRLGGISRLKLKLGERGPTYQYVYLHGSWEVSVSSRPCPIPGWPLIKIYNLVQVLSGSEEPAFRRRVSAAFKQFRIIKPQSSRPASREVFFVGIGFK